MTVIWRKSFTKDFSKLSKYQKLAWAKIYRLFLANQWHRSLRRHKLQGKYLGLESIDVMPDLRACFLQEEQTITFYFIRNHNQLYS